MAIGFNKFKSGELVYTSSRSKIKNWFRHGYTMPFVADMPVIIVDVRYYNDGACEYVYHIKPVSEDQFNIIYTGNLDYLNYVHKIKKYGTDWSWGECCLEKYCRTSDEYEEYLMKGGK